MTKKLFEAIANKDLDTVKVELVAGANINVRDNDDRTPLMIAVIYANKKIIQILLEAGANINARDIFGNTPFKAALNAGHVDIIKVLLKAGADGDSALFRASGLGDVDAIKNLLAAGVSVNVKDDYGDTALMRASSGGYVEAVKVLLAAGACVNTESRNGYTALKFACLRPREEIIKVLLKAGADCSTCFIDASRDGLEEVIKIFLEAGVDVNAKDNDARTALTEAHRFRHKGCMKALLEAGADTQGLNYCTDSQLKELLIETGRYGWKESYECFNLDVFNIVSSDEFIYPFATISVLGAMGLLCYGVYNFNQAFPQGGNVLAPMGDVIGVMPDGAPEVL